MKKYLNKIILAIGVIVILLGGFRIYTYKKEAQVSTREQVEIVKLQEFNVNLKADDIESYKILAGDYGGFRGDGNNLIRYKLKESLPLDKIFNKETSRNTKEKDKIERNSMLRYDGIEPTINMLKKNNSINSDMDASINKEGFLDKDREFAYEILYSDKVITDVGIISYSKEKKEILLYYDKI